MNRKSLEYFIAVAREGSIAKAAEALHLTQPALSRAIKVLEKELRGELFTRLPRGVHLTSAGKALLEPAKQILRDFQTAKASVESVQGLKGGTLDLIIMPGVLKDPGAEWISAFRQGAPKVAVRIHETESAEDIILAVREGENELGFCAIAPDVHDLAVTEVAQQTIVALLPPHWSGRSGTTVSNKELVEAGLIVGSYGEGRRIIDSYNKVMQTDLKPVIEVQRRDSALSLVLAGAGAALLPLAVARQAERAGATIRSLEEPLQRKIFLIERASTLSPAAGYFRQIATRVMPISA